MKKQLSAVARAVDQRRLLIYLRIGLCERAQGPVGKSGVQVLLLAFIVHLAVSLGVTRTAAAAHSSASLPQVSLEISEQQANKVLHEFADGDRGRLHLVGMGTVILTPKLLARLFGASSLQAMITSLVAAGLSLAVATHVAHRIYRVLRVPGVASKQEALLGAAAYAASFDEWDYRRKLDEIGVEILRGIEEPEHERKLLAFIREEKMRESGQLLDLDDLPYVDYPVSEEGLISSNAASLLRAVGSHEYALEGERKQAAMIKSDFLRIFEGDLMRRLAHYDEHGDLGRWSQELTSDVELRKRQLQQRAEARGLATDQSTALKMELAVLEHIKVLGPEGEKDLLPLIELERTSISSNQPFSTYSGSEDQHFVFPWPPFTNPHTPVVQSFKSDFLNHLEEKIIIRQYLLFRKGKKRWLKEINENIREVGRRLVSTGGVLVLTDSYEHKILVDALKWDLPYNPTPPPEHP